MSRDDGWEIARDTWKSGVRAGGGMWTQPAIDSELGLIYAIHHDLWDWDLVMARCSSM